MAPVRRQDLRRRLYGMAKADTLKRFGDLYASVSELETLRAGYALAQRNDGAPGLDGVTFEAIEAGGVEAFLAQLRDELVARTYRPLRYRCVQIVKEGGKQVRLLRIPAIRDGWSRGRSNSSWSRSSRRTFTTARTATVRSGQRGRRWRGWRRPWCGARRG